MDKVDSTQCLRNEGDEAATQNPLEKLEIGSREITQRRSFQNFAEIHFDPSLFSSSSYSSLGMPVSAHHSVTQLIIF